MVKVGTIGTSMTFSYMMGPSVPGARVAEVRQAFRHLFKDPDFLQEARQHKVMVEALSDEAITRNVATFYSMFETRPVGRHNVAICTNISCWLNGAEDIVRHCERKYGIKLGESSADGRIYLKKEEECLAACCGAPMMVVDGHYHENLTIGKIDRILDELK